MPLLKVNQIASYSGNTLTIGTTGDTVTLAAGSTSSGFGATYNGAVNWTSNIVTSALTLSAGIGYWVNTSSAAITATLPASASVGDTIILTDFYRTFATNNLTLNQNSLKFQGNTSPNPVYNTAGQTIQLVYSGATQGWIPISDDDVTNETPQSYSIDFLVIAGGGGGGSVGGGGGAGGYRTTTQTVSTGTAITITVGDGGAGSALTTGDAGLQGTSSSISGSGLTTITSAGGGGGAADSGGTTLGTTGGSGGGGCQVNPGLAGNTPSTSPSQGNNGGTGSNTGPSYGSGGGGGSGAIGSNGTTTTGGAGGTGTASSITGSSVTRAGGGGGGAIGGTGGAGGTGGGGAGGGTISGTAGTANTGGGGGGGGYTPVRQASGAGGKGVVILSMPLASFSGTVTGSPTESTSGSNKILVFNGSGSYTT